MEPSVFREHLINSITYHVVNLAIVIPTDYKFLII